MDVLGLDVETSTVRRWAGWLAPACQPFSLTSGEVADLGLAQDRSGGALPAELHDTYQMWNVSDELQLLAVHDLIRTAPPGVILHRYSLRDVSAPRTP